LKKRLVEEEGEEVEALQRMAVQFVMEWIILT